MVDREISANAGTSKKLSSATRLAQGSQTKANTNRAGVDPVIGIL